MPRIGSGMRGLITILLAATAPLACSDATDVQLLEIGGSGVLFGQAFLDFDGDGSLGGGDQPIPGVGIVLVTSNTAEVVLLANTDSTGTFALFDVPVGSYLLSVDSAAVGDSLEVLGADRPIEVSLNDTALVNLGVTYPSRTIEEVLSEPVGRRVFTSGIALNPRLNFDLSGQVHFSGSTAFLRAINVERANLLTGDSVRLLGQVVLDNGRPALEGVTPNVLISSAVLPIPRETDPATAAAADGGALDAALVRVRNVEITDTSTNVDGNFRFWAVDGADSVEIVVRGFLGLNTSALRPDTTVRLSQATGLLTPFDDAGAIRWRVLPRSGGDLSLETKTADIAVVAALDTAAATLADTVEVTVIASNAGPLIAHGVSIRDTVPTGLGFVSSTQSRGSFDSGTGIWSIGDVAPGEADTLRLLLQVNDTTRATAPIVSESLGLTFEVDPNPSNNLVTVTLTIFP